MISPRQCRAARAVLGWTVRGLAARAGLRSHMTIHHFEAGRTAPRTTTLARIAEVYQANGLVFSDDGRALSWSDEDARYPEQSASWR